MLPSRRHQSASLTNQRHRQTRATRQVMKTITPFVTEPVAVDRFVDTGLKARDAILISFDADVATGAAARANRRGLLQVPDPHFETKIAIGQRPHRANIDDIDR